MADEPDFAANPCCALWNDKFSKLQNKYSKLEEGRTALRRAIDLYDRQNNQMQIEIGNLKKAYDEEKQHAENERKEKEKESVTRVSLENEVFALKSEILSLRQKGCSEVQCLREELTRANEEPIRVNDELKLARQFDGEAEMNQLKDQLQEARTQVVSEKRKAKEEKKRADGALKIVEAEKSKVYEELKLLQVRCNSGETEIIGLRDQLKEARLQVDSEKNKAKEEKKRADGALRVAEAEKSKAYEELRLLQARDNSGETEMNQLRDQLLEARLQVDSESKKAEAEKKRADDAWKHAEAEKSRVDEELTLLRTRVSSGEVEINLLRQNLQEERTRAKSEVKRKSDEVCETSKFDKSGLESIEADKESGKLKESAGQCFEDEISSLKSQILSLQQIADLEAQNVNEELELMRVRLSEGEREIKRLNEVLDKEKMRADSMKKKAESEKKKAKAEKKKAVEAWKAVKGEKMRVDEERRIADSERTKAEEKRLLLETLKVAANEARSKLVSVTLESEELNKKLEVERQLLIKERKRADLEKDKAEKQRKIAETNMMNALEEKSRADKLTLQLEENRRMMEDLRKHKLVPVSLDKLDEPPAGISMNVETAKMKLLKQELKLEKRQVKHAKQVVKLEKSQTKMLQQEFTRIKAEFQQFSHRLELCNCFTECHVGIGHIAKNGYRNSKRKFVGLDGHHMQLQRADELLKPSCAVIDDALCFKQCIDCSAPMPPKSGNHTECTSGTTFKLQPLLRDSSMASFSDNALVGSQERCAFSISKLPEWAEKKSKYQNVSKKDGHRKKRSKIMEVEGCIDHFGNSNVQKDDIGRRLIEQGNVSLRASSPLQNLSETAQAGEEGICESVSRYLDCFEEVGVGSYMKLLDLDDADDEESYRLAIERPLSPSLPEIDGAQDSSMNRGMSDFGNKGSTILCGSKFVSTNDDSPQQCVVFSSITESSSLTKIFCTTKYMKNHCLVSSQTNIRVQNLISALVEVDNLLPKEKVCVFFSLLLNNCCWYFKDLVDTEFIHFSDFSIDHMMKVMSDVETRRILTELCILDELITLIEDFLIDRRVLVCNDGSNRNTVEDYGDTRLSFQTASSHQVMCGAIVLASLCAVYDRIGFLCEASYNIARMRKLDSSVLTALHVFTKICGSEYFALSGYSLIIDVMKSLVTLKESESRSTDFASSHQVMPLEGPTFPLCTHCPFSEGAVSLNVLTLRLMEKMHSCSRLHKSGFRTCQSKDDFDGNLYDLGDVVSLLELVASNMSWDWTCDNIIVQLLVMLESHVLESTLAAGLILLGQLARIGIDANGSKDSTIEKIRSKFCVFLYQNAPRKVSLPIQIVAANSLLGMVSLSLEEAIERTMELPEVDCIRKWFSLLSNEEKSLAYTSFKC